VISRSRGRISIVLIITCIIIVQNGWARNHDGSLGLIRYPISTRPALVTSGSSITLELISDKPVSDLCVELFTGTKSFPIFKSPQGQVYDVLPRRAFDKLGKRWAGRDMVTLTDLVQVGVDIPKSIADGLYGLRVRCSAGVDTNERAVRVFSSWPTKYNICHLTDVHIGKKDMPNTDGIFRAVARHVNREKPAFVIITGDVTDNSLPDEYRVFLSVLDTFEVPTFVVPGNHDSYGGLGDGTADVERFLGDGNYSFSFGSDYYLGMEGVAGKFTDEHKAIIERYLSPSLGGLRCVFNHDEYDKIRTWLDGLLDQYNVQLYLYGHHHQNLVEFRDKVKRTSVLTDATFTHGGCYNTISIEDGTVTSVKLHVGQI